MIRINPFTRFVILLPTTLLLGVTLFASVSYRETRNAMIAEFQAALREEITALETIYQQQGHKALIEVVTARAKANTGESPNETVAVYLLTDAKGRKLAGNLAAWPATAQAQDESSLQFVDPLTGDTVVAVVFLLYADQRLLVGRRALFEHVGRHLWENYALLVASALVVSLLSGWAFTSGLRQRLGRISATAERIRHGHMNERIPETRSDDEIERLVRQLNRMLDQVESLMQHARTTSSAIAHDLRHPISRLRNELELLADEAGETPMRDRLESLQGDIDHILKVFQAVLRLGRLEAGAYALQFEDTDLAELVSDAVSLYEPIAEAQGRAILLQTLAGRTAVDRDLIFQAVANLIDNALRYGAGDVEVSVAHHNISVRDHGEGIPEADRERVLQPFVRLDDSRSMPGSGLGLTLVRAIVESHGGQLSLDDAQPGLRINLTLPGAVGARVAP
ncbi:signal transduction histidine kinase [Chitinivorax tropicus]|uniref:histidine kinase n=1 Tax=Chitinivorax tropicus TaxID=714531 RepID=A0A840MNB1_9PROT|nr:HAMP domain-containing sensor histidine kinase [Chitinivorax tropicus]MBB5018589.1 signal transduction histidine kinase [Chitinivorax tropicus]